MRQPSAPVKALSMNSLRSAWTGASAWPNQSNIRAKPVFANLENPKKCLTSPASSWKSIL
jgi:hypothetical protein